MSSPGATRVAPGEVATPGCTRATRRARPLLGTLVEVGVACDGEVEPMIAAAFAAIADVQRRLSRFDAASEIGRFHALAAGGSVAVEPDSAEVLAAARELHLASHGLFDITQGTGPDAWHCDGHRLHKRRDAVRLDLGGIAKGHAVDRAVAALRGQGCAAGWVNAGGDLRVFGDIDVPVNLRDEDGGGVRPFATLGDGALATSRLQAHVSVAAPCCRWADALTKVVALSRDPHHPLLARYGARAWLH
ncbi:MAG TPA: FAD:protein FMN transferase [Albitalea sp.]|uniref:FAD:protein FMN transferase n=1 Tax=Piscinibacter sp. TaxID=1903157 RepID=UPI002ED077CD